MGPASDNAGYAQHLAMRPEIVGHASMGPASDNAGYAKQKMHTVAQVEASMGPASDNAGYGEVPARAWFAGLRLQWVRRLITPVMEAGEETTVNGRTVLQWVRRLITPVMPPVLQSADGQGAASMGPASDNAGYVHERRADRRSADRFNGSGV